MQPAANLCDVIRQKEIQIGIITVPAERAQQVADELVAAGIKGIWNFAPIRLTVPSHVTVISEDLSVGLSSLSYFLSRQYPE